MNMEKYGTPLETKGSGGGETGFPLHLGKEEGLKFCMRLMVQGSNFWKTLPKPILFCI